MDAFLKTILEPSEQDTFDHFTRIETPTTRTPTSGTPTSEDAQPSANMALPDHLTQRFGSWPAYTTYVAPVVKMLIEQDKWRKRVSKRPAETEPNREPPEAGLEEETQALSKLSRDSSIPRTGQDSVGTSKAENSLPSPSVCKRVIFASKPSSRLLPCSSLAPSVEKK